MMKQILRREAEQIIEASIRAVQPDTAVRGAVEHINCSGRLILVAAGKAAWQMAGEACRVLGERIYQGIVITKYGHVKGALPRILCREAGHPLPDAAGFKATEEALAMTENLSPEDVVLFLLSGGGSALFEKPLLPEEELLDITRRLLACGADIREVNTIRKRLSAVKGGRFALHCAPARVEAVILSDVVGDQPDMIASGPVWGDTSTREEALAVVQKYGLSLSEEAMSLLAVDPPRKVNNVNARITGSVSALCRAAAGACEKLGYEAVILTDTLSGEARAAGAWLGELARDRSREGKNLALIAGGETVVKLTGSGLGGRNQELALAAAGQIRGLSRVAVFSVGSDGTDGPTDAAGGYADGGTEEALEAQGLSIAGVLADNDSYHALKTTGGLIITGPTGTNVNDVAVALVRGKL